MRLPSWLPVVAAAVAATWIAAETWTGVVTAMWLCGAYIFLAAQLLTLHNATPGDTLSGHVWRLLRGGWWRELLLLALLAWLFWHWVFQPSMPK